MRGTGEIVPQNSNAILPLFFSPSWADGTLLPKPNFLLPFYSVIKFLLLIQAAHKY